MATRNNHRRVTEHPEYSLVPHHREIMEALARANLTTHEFRVVFAVLYETNLKLNVDCELNSKAYWQACTLLSRKSLNATIRRLVSRNIMVAKGRRYWVTRPNEWDPSRR